MTEEDQSGSAFAILGLDAPVVRALVDEGYDEPTAVQREVIPIVLGGRDLLARAETGTGKTAAFLLPVLQRFAAANHAGLRRVRILVLVPTRELAAQIHERAGAYGRYLDLRYVVVYGGVKASSQQVALRRGCDVVIATPGRLLDLVGQKELNLSDVDTVVLDEADRMLDMGFVPDVRRILAQMPRRKQTLLFSATMPESIRRLADEILRDPASIDVSPDLAEAPKVSHSVWHVSQAKKYPLLLRILEQDKKRRRVIVFTRTREGANELCKQLVRAGLSADVIHRDKFQRERERALDAFRKGTTRVLVATEVAARGIDVDDVGLVVNYDLPDNADSYIHRIGRTGRAGNAGAAVSFCDASEAHRLREIESKLGFRISVSAR